MNPQLPFFAMTLGLPLVSPANLMGLNQSSFNYSVPNPLASALNLQNTSSLYFGNDISNALGQTDPVFQTTKKQKLDTFGTISSLFSTPLDSKAGNEFDQSRHVDLTEDDDCVFLGSVPKNQLIASNPLTSNQSIDFTGQGALLNLLTQQSFFNSQIDTSALLPALLQNTAPLDISMFAKGNTQYDLWNQIQINSLLGQQLNQNQANEISCASTQSNSLVASRNSTSCKTWKNQDAILIDDELSCQTSPSQKFEGATLIDTRLKPSKKESYLKTKGEEKSSKNWISLGSSLKKEEAKQKSLIENTPKTSRGDEQSTTIEYLDTGASLDKDVNLPKLSTQHAQIPAFEMFDNSGNKSKRNIKSVWTPCSIGLENYAIYHKKIEETVGMEISNQEKVIQTLKGYNMSLKDACDNLKRNKAQSRHFFKVEKKPRDRVAKV